MTFQAKPFGSSPAPLMFVAKYENDGWDNGTIEPFTDLVLSPFAMCFHYGQTVFEGLKAYRSEDDQILVFRQQENFLRMNKSLERMAMPTLPQKLWEEGILSLISNLRDEVPPHGEGSLYIRPFALATQPKLGVELSDEYLFLVTACQVGAYYDKNLKVKVEKEFTRAAPGGAGSAKCGGNYGSAFYPFKKAKAEGFDQILWTDSKSHEFFEESGTMNFGFFIEDTFITPPASDTILDGITRKSIIELVKDKGYKVEVRPFSVTELKEAFTKGLKIEAFGLGTAAVIAPFESISIDGVKYACYCAPDAKMFNLKKELKGIQEGKVFDKYGWNTIVEKFVEA
ncbi:MAG: branched chain amino acid aminotransferase [Thalassobius sp.]|nr:branched chain amino acid aminotransferase [Thalassovita sp.]